MIDKGKYGADCERICRKRNADAVLLVVIGGNKGHDFTVVGKRPDLTKLMPKILRSVADEIEASMKKAEKN